jgi:hypothetical protein
MNVSGFIDELGGNAPVAKECEISESAVSQWRSKGMPNPWKKFFKQKHPRIFKKYQGEAHVTPN